MAECVARLEHSDGKKLRKSWPRSKIFVPESKNRATAVIQESQKFAVAAPTPPVKNVAVTDYVHTGSFSTETVGFDEDDEEDAFERAWVQ